MKFFAVIGIVVSVVGFMALAAILNGLALSVLWGWFIVPLGAPSISIPLAIGVAMVAGYLTKQDIDVVSPERSPAASIGRSVALVLLKPGFALLMGWIVQMFL